MEYKTLGEIVDFVDGDRGKNYPKGNEFFDNGYCLFLDTSNVTKDGLNLSSVHFISKEKDEKLRNGKIQKNEIVITTRGTIGNSILSNNLLSQYPISRINSSMLILRKKSFAAININYLYYLFKSSYFQKCLMSFASGSAQPQLPVKDLKNIKIPIISMKQQNNLISILSAYDDLIENNNKRIKLLEQMAENLYKEWFVRFRFSGYESTEFENGIPKGWNYSLLQKCFSFVRGISYSSEEIDCEEGLNLINLKNIQSYGGFRREGTKKFNGKYKPLQLVQKGDLIMGVTDMTQDRRTVGSVALVPNIVGTSVISADLVKIVSHIDNIFLYCMCRYGFYSRFFSQFANGANVLHLKPDALSTKKILLPSDKLIQQFTKLVFPLIEMIDQLNLEIDNVIKQRDLLLPRLMSGKLEVAMENKEPVKTHKFDYINKEWANRQYDASNFAVAARKDGTVSEESISKLKAIAEEDDE